MAVRYIETCRLPTPFGVFDMHGFEEPDTGKEHVALTLGDIDSAEPLLEEALRSIAREGRGILMYLRQEGRGIGLLNKIRAYRLQDQGADTVEANERLGFGADLRDYSMCKDMLEHLGIKSLRLMTNNPRKVKALESYGINIAERVPLHVGRNPHNEHYLNTKQSKLGHWLETHQDDDPV